MREKDPISLDREVLDWFRAQGKGYQSRINALLLAYKEAHGRAWVLSWATGKIIVTQTRST